MWWDILKQTRDTAALSKGTYTRRLPCDNCHCYDNYEIPKGEDVLDFMRYGLCSNCGTKRLAKW